MTDTLTHTHDGREEPRALPQEIHDLLARNRATLSPLTAGERRRVADHLIDKLRPAADAPEPARARSWAASGCPVTNLRHVRGFAARFCEQNFLDLGAEVLLRALPGARLQALPEAQDVISGAVAAFVHAARRKEVDDRYTSIAAGLERRWREEWRRHPLLGEEVEAWNSPARKAEVTMAMVRSMRRVGRARGWLGVDERYGGNLPEIAENFPGRPDGGDRRALESFYGLNPAWRPGDFRAVFEAAARLREGPCDGTWLWKVKGVQSALNHIRKVRDELEELTGAQLPPVGETRDWYGLRWTKYRRR